MPEVIIVKDQDEAGEPNWRMHGHAVQSKRPLWSEDAGYPHIRRVASCGNGSHPVGNLVSGRWFRRFFEISFRGNDGQDRKSTRLNSSHSDRSRMPSSA